MKRSFEKGYFSSVVLISGNEITRDHVSSFAIKFVGVFKRMMNKIVSGTTFSCVQ